jgi:NitT/TauT family transport system ATP-binding protein
MARSEWVKTMEKVTIMGLEITFFTENSTPVTAIQDMDLSVEAGEFVCIVGPSGCGKTTFLRILAGLEKPTSGTIAWDGGSSQSTIGFVFQQHNLLPWRTVYGNIAYGLELRGTPQETRDDVVARLVSLMNLSGFERSYPKELSGGMQKRVAIARALAIDPDIMLMDEPSFHSMPRHATYCRWSSLRYGRKRKIPSCFITHNVDEAVFLADRVVILAPRPTRVKTEVPITLARPRDRTDAKFTAVRKTILEQMNF